MIRPSIALLALSAVGLVLADEPAAPPGSAPLPARDGAALIADLNALHTRLEIHSAYYAGRDSWLNVGVAPLPPPRKWGRR